MSGLVPTYVWAVGRSAEGRNLRRRGPTMTDDGPLTSDIVLHDLEQLVESDPIKVRHGPKLPRRVGDAVVRGRGRIRPLRWRCRRFSRLATDDRHCRRHVAPGLYVARQQHGVEPLVVLEMPSQLNEPVGRV